jgi:hypothetical protein
LLQIHRDFRKSRINVENAFYDIVREIKRFNKEASPFGPRPRTAKSKAAEIQKLKREMERSQWSGPYRPLNIDNYEIRLLKLKEGFHGGHVTTGPLEYSLEYASLIKPPKYIALSYCWGGGKKDEGSKY